MTSETTSVSKKMLKILCLHGCYQNKDVFKSKIGSFRKGVAKIAELHFVDSPHKIVKVPADTDECKSWWFTTGKQEYISREPSDIDIGFRESVETVEKFVQDEGPFDGLMGFSQGATLAAIICSMIEKQKFKGKLNFVILVAGFKSRCSPHKEYYDSVLSIPSLHVIGDSDQVISKERSDELVSLFQDAIVYRHQGGHFVPAAKEAKENYLNFLSNFS